MMNKLLWLIAGMAFCLATGAQAQGTRKGPKAERPAVKVADDSCGPHRDTIVELADRILTELRGAGPLCDP